MRSYIKDILPVKRLVDVILTCLGLIIIWPLILLIAACIRIFIGSPVLFRQVRPGFGGKPFMVYKFRSMNEKKDGQGNLLPDGERLTGLGKSLRTTSLDELP